jgi:enoyl-CoA hydratase/carnithine racemase
VSPPSVLEVEADGPIGSLRLARPDRLNALSSELMEELISAASRFDAVPEVRAVVVSGSGAAFCAGFDVAEFAMMSGDEHGLAAARLGSAMAQAIESMRAITVAALHGRVVGGGLVLAAACDLRVAAEDTIFSIPEVDLGIPLLWDAIPRLVREIGPARTKELVMTCRPFTAADAHDMGFLNRVVPAGEVAAVAGDLAAGVAARPRIPVEMTKRQVAAALGSGDPIGDEEALLASLADREALDRRAAYLRRFTGA